MKFTILSSALAASALELSPSDPFTGLGNEYEQLLTVDPKIAIDSGRPNCLLNKCHLKNKVTGGKICISVKESEGPVFGFEYLDGSWKPAGAPNFFEDKAANSSGDLQGFGYSCINYVVEKGKHNDLGNWIKTFKNRDSNIATLLYSDYQALVQNEDVKANIHFIEIHVIAPDNVDSVTAIENITWLVTDQAHGQRLFEKTNAQNILIQEQASFNDIVLAGNANAKFCTNQ